MRAFQIAGLIGSMGFFICVSSFATTRYVDVSNATPSAPFTNWGIASTNIQMAINVAASGDEILVAPGTYLLSGIAVQIPSGKTLMLRSTQSREAIIDAQKLSKGMYVGGTNSLVEGFTIRNGFDESGYGGGIDIETACTVRDCLVTSNQAWEGGGIDMIYGAALVENCTIQSNLATHYGGGVNFYYSPGLVNNCLISDNISSNYGGGVCCYMGGGTVSNCWIAMNQSGTGGGVQMALGGALVNSVVVGNHAKQYGGGIYSSGPATNLAPVVNCTIVSNTADMTSGGVFSFSTTRFVNNIIYFNTAPANDNLFMADGTSVVSNCCVTPDFGASNFTNAPVFADMAAQDFHLATASICIDAGTTNDAPPIDYDGHLRPRVGTPGGAALPDVGAYEYGFHFNDIVFASSNIVRLLWDVQDLGVYRLDAQTNNGIVPSPWIENIAAYTNPGLAAGQFLVHTQTLVIPPPMPTDAAFRLRISH